MADNPFAVSAFDDQQLHIDDDASATELPLASRWARLGALILDSVIMLGVIAPVYIGGLLAVYGLDDFEEGLAATESVFQQLAIVVAVFAIFVAINGYLIYRRQQTVGKLALGIKVVRDDGSPVAGNTYVFVRYLPIYLIEQIPIIGFFFFLIDALLIFRSNKKCLHDDFAKTMVVRCR